MNSLSWFIYLTQVTENVGTAAGVTLTVVGIFGGLPVLGLWIFTIVDADDRYMGETARAAVPARNRLTKVWVAVMSLALLAAVLMPTRQTMLLIAGSEMGERMVNSEGVNSVVNPGIDLLKTWIKRETEKLTKEAAK